MADNWWEAHPVVNGGQPAAGAPQAPSMTVSGQPSNQQFQDISDEGYLAPSDLRNLMMDIYANDGKQAATILNSAPRKQAAVEYQKGIAKEEVVRETSRKAGLNVLQELNKLALVANEQHVEDPAAFGKAIGPYATAPFMSHLPLVGGMTPPQANAAYSPDGDVSTKRPWDYQNRLNHQIEGLTTTFMASAGKGMNMSDARQAEFKSTMGAMMKATDKKAFDKIVGDAADVIAEAYDIPHDMARAKVQGMAAQMFAAQQGAQPPAQGAQPPQQPAPMPQQPPLPQDAEMDAAARGAGRFSAPKLALPAGITDVHTNPKTGATIGWDGSKWQRLK